MECFQMNLTSPEKKRLSRLQVILLCFIIKKKLITLQEPRLNEQYIFSNEDRESHKVEFHGQDYSRKSSAIEISKVFRECFVICLKFFRFEIL